jgi:hypothetical protein
MKWWLNWNQVIQQMNYKVIIESLIRGISSFFISLFIRKAGQIVHKTRHNYLNDQKLDIIYLLHKNLELNYTQINKKSLNDDQKNIVKQIKEILHVSSNKIEIMANETLLDKLRFAYEGVNRTTELKLDLAKGIMLAKDIVKEQKI